MMNLWYFDLLQSRLPPNKAGAACLAAKRVNLTSIAVLCLPWASTQRHGAIFVPTNNNRMAENVEFTRALLKLTFMIVRAPLEEYLCWRHDSGPLRWRPEIRMLSTGIASRKPEG